MARYQLISKFCADTGYSADAVKGKIASGVWRYGVVWRHAPDGHRVIDVEGFNEWVISQGLECAQEAKPRSRSTSDSGARGAGKASNLSPPPLI